MKPTIFCTSCTRFSSRASLSAPDFPRREILVSPAPRKDSIYGGNIIWGSGRSRHDLRKRPFLSVFIFELPYTSTALLDKSGDDTRLTDFCWKFPARWTRAIITTHNRWWSLAIFFWILFSACVWKQMHRVCVIIQLTLFIRVKKRNFDLYMYIYTYTEIKYNSFFT